MNQPLKPMTPAIRYEWHKRSMENTDMRARLCVALIIAVILILTLALTSYAFHNL